MSFATSSKRLNLAREWVVTHGPYAENIRSSQLVATLEVRPYAMKFLYQVLHLSGSPLGIDGVQRVDTSISCECITVNNDNGQCNLQNSGATCDIVV